ncbi:MAG: hypothetical protein ABIJ95_03285 [Pseudomonadota bacterium]
MANDNAIVYYEVAQNDVAMVALTDAGDHLEFQSADEVWSLDELKTPVVRPNGVLTGLTVTVAASGTNDKIDVVGGTLNLNGVETTIVASADETVTRAVAADTHIINSVTITSAGAIAILAGTDHATAFSETRGAAGGPPWIPTTSVEIAQIRMASNVAAAVAADEIKMVQNSSRELTGYPVWDVEPIRVENRAMGLAGITFLSALPQIHSDDAGATTAGKAVHASYSVPSYAEAPDAYDWTPSEVTHSTSSKQVYGRVRAARSRALTAGSFGIVMGDGISDAILDAKDSVRWVKFKANRYATPTQYTCGALGISRSNPADGNTEATVTVASELATVDVVS